MPDKAVARDKAHFDDLTDDLLRHVTSFLPGNDALQTCVLDTRWRDIWRRTTNLLLVFDESSFPSCERFKQLVKLFINLRGNSPLNKCDISACPEDQTGCTYTNTKLLIEYSLACQLKELLVRKVGICNMDKPLTFDVPLISHHLKIIDLVLVNLEHSALDFSGCLVLEVLKMQGCRIRAHRMSSNSLKHLWITDLCSFPTKFHVRIYAPGLISLQLDGFIGLSPFLENMPFLVTAYVELGSLCNDVLYCYDHLEDCDISFCSCHAYPVGEGVLLNGLSNAANLELIAHPRTFIYDWDLEWCPIFGKLKSLLLNDWFLAIDQLVCILQHSPILEMLTLHLENTEELVSATGGQEVIEQPFVCAHLKVVNIECKKVDVGIRKIWKILTRSGILREQISIKDGCFPPSDGNIEALELWEPRRPSPPLMARWMCAQS